MSRDDLNPHGIARPSASTLARLELDALEDRSRLDHHRPISSRTLDTIRAGLDLLDAVQNPGIGSGQRAAAARTLEAAGTTRADLEQLEQRARLQSFLDKLGTVLDELDERPAGRDRVQLAGSLELDTLEPCEHGHQECAHEPRGRCSNEAADDLDKLDRRTLAARALEATRAAITAPRPILAAFLEDGTYSIGQLAAVLDVSTWTPAELDRLEAAQDRDRLALALEIDGVRP